MSKKSRAHLHPIGPCPTPEKKAHGNEHQAVFWAKRMLREHNASGQVYGPAYAYKCACGMLHLTRRATFGDEENVPILDVAEAVQRWAIGEA